MNKTILIAGGASVASLAVGAAGGYFLAKKRFDATIDELIVSEVEKTKKYFSIRLMEKESSGKPDDPADLVSRSSNKDREEPVSEETPDDETIDTTQEKIKDKADKALTDYQSISTRKVSESEKQNPEHSGLIRKNVFAEDKHKKVLPPRGPGGKFRPKSVREQENDPPQLIDIEEFLENEHEHEQESLLYFVTDKTLVLSADATQSVDIALAGEVNLTLFPTVDEDEESIIYVRNTGMSIDYEIKRMDESLTDYIGLGENSSGDDEELDASAYL